MNNVKGVLGFIVLGTSLYFISNAFSQWEFNLLNRDLFISVLIGITLLTTLYILGVFKFTHDTPVEKVSSIRMIFALIFAALTFYLITGLMGKSLGELETFLPQAEETPTIRYNNTNDTENSPWLENYEQALTIAKKTNKPIFIDFTGLSCTNCKKMERTIFPLKSIQKRMNKMVKVKLITDVRKEPYISNKEFQRRMFNSIEIPLYVILSPDEKLIAKTEYTPRVNDFIQFLNKGIDRN
jgi:thiol:disulfide interchange protein DsbD